MAEWPVVVPGRAYGQPCAYGHRCCLVGCQHRHHFDVGQCDPCRPIRVADLTALRAENERLRAALADATEGLVDMLPYVDPYFANKHDHAGYVERAIASRRAT